MKIPTVSNFLGFFDLTTGGLIIGGFDVVVYGLTLLTLIINIVSGWSIIDKEELNQFSVLGYLVIDAAVQIVLMVFFLVISVLFIYGVKTAILPITILAKDFQLQVIPSECSIGTREIPFVSLISRQPQSFDGKAFDNWSCLENDKEECSASFTNLSFFSQNVMFSNEGSYEIISEITFNDLVKNSTSKVLVDSKIIPHVQIKFFPQQPINVIKANEIVVTVLNLIPKCLTYWNLISGDGFAGFKEGVDGEKFVDMGLTVIKDFEEYFLQELVDYDNNTVSKDIALTLPENILIENENYKFRLSIICPEPLTETTTQASRNNVTSFYDVILTTNAPPETLPLVMSPTNGIPMKTIFKFSTGAAKDSSSDFPLKYSFGYIVNNLTVFIGKFYENTVATTQLPFSDDIKTFYEVCDNNGACRRTEGEKVSANENFKYSKYEIEFKLQEFESTLKRSEYMKSFNAAVVFLLTQSKFSDSGTNNDAKILLNLKNELEKLKLGENSGYMYQQKVVEFIEMSKNLMGIMKETDENFVENLLSLTERSQKSQRSKRATFSNKFSSPKVVSHDTNYIKNVLELSEMLLKSENPEVVKREKGKFVKKVHEFVGSLCQDRHLNTLTISSKSVIFEVTKVFSPQLFIEKLILPGDEKATMLFTSNMNFPSKYLCVGKIKFFTDMFDFSSTEKTSVFETFIVQDGKSFPTKEISEFVTVELVGDSTMTCEVFEDKQWKDCERQKVNGSRITCKCRTNDGGVVVKAVKAQIKPTVSPSETSKVTQFTFLTTRLTEKPETSTPIASTPSTAIETEKLSTQSVSNTSEVSTITSSGTSETTIQKTSTDTLTTELQNEVTTVSSTVTETVSVSHTTDIFTTTSEVLKNAEVTTATSEVSKPSTADPNVANDELKSPVTSKGPDEVKSTEKSTLSTTSVPPLTPAPPTISAPTTTPAPPITPAPSTTPAPPTTQKTEKPATATTKSDQTANKNLITTNKPVSSDDDLIRQKPAPNGIADSTTNPLLPMQSNETYTYTVKSSTSSWTLIIILLVFFGTIIALFSIHKCRQYANSNFNLPDRNPSKSIKYAKYHDEFTMRG